MRPEFTTIVNEWFHANARELPWRQPGYGPWGVLVSEVMLQQTPVARVVPAIASWLRTWPTPAMLAASPPADAVRAWGRLGYPRRALWLREAAGQIVERHRGRVPEDLDALLALRGVGDYTARAVAVFAFGQRHPVVDTNTRRVITRAVAGQAEPAPPSLSRDLVAMDALLPEDDDEARVFNAAIMELGAIVCTARAPRCDDCPIRDRCAWRAAGRPPYDGPRRARQKRFEGSDRHVRGLIMQELRSADAPTPESRLRTVWADDGQFARALASLVADGLAVDEGVDGFTLPRDLERPRDDHVTLHGPQAPDAPSTSSSSSERGLR